MCLSNAEGSTPFFQETQSDFIKPEISSAEGETKKTNK